MVPAVHTSRGPVADGLSRVRHACHEQWGRIRLGNENAGHHRPACQLIGRRAAKVISRDYQLGAINAVKSMHWSCSFGSVIACWAVGADANAQHAAGEGIHVRARLTSQVTGAVASVDADDEHDQDTGHCS
jgi:hypothetical protein